MNLQKKLLHKKIKAICIGTDTPNYIVNAVGKVLSRISIRDVKSSYNNAPSILQNLHKVGSLPGIPWTFHTEMVVIVFNIWREHHQFSSNTVISPTSSNPLLFTRMDIRGESTLGVHTCFYVDCDEVTPQLVTSKYGIGLSRCGGVGVSLSTRICLAFFSKPENIRLLRDSSEAQKFLGSNM